MGLYVRALRKCAVFSGRASRREFLVFTLVNALIGYALVQLIESIPGPLVVWGSGLESPRARALLISLGVGLQDPQAQYRLMLLYAAAFAVLGLAVAVRRLHDTRRNGWWLLSTLIPYVGSVILLVLLLLPGEAQENPYGPAPD